MTKAWVAAHGWAQGMNPETLAQLSGLDFCQAFTDQLMQAHGADLVAVGALKVTEAERIQVLAGCFDGLPLADFEYETRVAPCREVIANGAAQTIPDRVSVLYPEGDVFGQEGIQSYVGVALRDSAGEIIGVVQACGRKPLNKAQAQRLVAVLEAFAPRLGAELAAMQRMDQLAVLAGGPSRPSPEAALGYLAEQLQSAFNVRNAFIAETLEHAPGQFRLLACSTGGQRQAAMEGRVFAYEDNPCAHVRDGAEFLVEADLPVVFPQRIRFDETPLQSYLGFPLLDDSGRLIGHFAVQHDQPICRSRFGAGLATLFAGRIGLELRRRRADCRRDSAEQAHLIEDKAESLSLMAGTIAHEFNNLLASMQGQAELALAHLGQGHPALTHLQGFERDLQSAATVVGQLMMYAKRGSTSGQAACDLNALVRDTLGRLPELAIVDPQGGQASDAAPADSCPADDSNPANTSPAAPLRHIKLDLAEGALAAHLDGAQVGQLLMELMRNAVEAIGDEPGRITVTTRRCQLDSAERRNLLKGAADLPPGDCLLLEVRDSGCGMTSQTLTRVFDPFFTTKPDSRGLGMSGALGVVGHHQGALSVESTEGEGSVFRFYFPACEPAALPKETLRPMAARSDQPLRILVVDDEDTVRRAVAGLLQLRGCEVVQADGGAAAQALMADLGRFDGAVIDMNMPGTGGWETLTQLRQAQPELNAVMMSGYAISAAEAGFPDLADVQVLDKPFTKEKLYRAIFS